MCIYVCMYVCVCVCVYIYIYIYIYINTHTPHSYLSGRDGHQKPPKISTEYRFNQTHFKR